MITKAMLEEWRKAKNAAVLSLDIEPSLAVAVQEMYIEAKQLRRDNLRLLDTQDLLAKLLTYVGASAQNHYLTEDMEEDLDTIRELCDELNLEI